MRTPSKTQLFILLMYLAVGIGFSIHPIYPHEMLLQHSITIVVFIVLIFLSLYQKIDTASLLCISLFMMMHCIAARWIYSYVPYDEWSKFIFKDGIQHEMNWHRNHFDRLIHFLYGLLFSYPIYKIVHDTWKNSIPISFFLVFMIILGTSAVYELFEWYISLLLSPEAVENYNGQQGDNWDAQKDMALAGLGSMLMILGLALSSTFSYFKQKSYLSQ